MSDGRSRLLALTTSFAALTLVAATCRKDSPPASAPPADPPAPAAAPSEAAAPAAAEVSGLDLSTLPEPARAEVQKVLSDEFCYCGCPHTIGGCLKEHPTCEHAKREAQLAAWLAEAGERSFEIIAELGKYYRSFKEPRKSFDLTNTACRGPADAPVTIVEFADFQCPSCGAAHPILVKFLAKAEGKVRFCFKNYPLPAHPDALWAAEAGEYARQHGKFWELHDVMFENQDRLRLINLRDYAKHLGLDTADFEKAVSSDSFMTQINASKEEGRAAGVDSTPTLFINGRKMVLPPSVGILLRTLEDEREWKEKGGWRAD